MDTTGVIVILLGAVAGLGVALLLKPLLPSAPALGPALARLHPTGHTRSQLASSGTWDLTRFVPVPRAELALLGKTDRDYYTSVITAALLGLLTPTAISVILMLGDIGLPIVFPAFAGIGCAALFAVSAHREMVGKAKKAAREFKQAVAIYLDLVAMERAAGQAPVSALERAARVGQGHWVFVRIRQALQRAQLQMRPPWQELQILAEEIQVPALDNLAKIMESSGQGGAQVHETLRASADALRSELQLAEVGEAEAMNSFLDAPGALMLLVLTVFFIFPLLAPLASI